MIRRRWMIASVLACCAMSLGLLAAPGCKRDAAGVGKVRIAVIPKGTTHDFWKSVEAGAKAAGAERGVEIIWKAPPKEDDMQDQIALVQQFIAEGVDGIVLAPLDSKGLLKPVQSAGERKIPVVIFDSALDGEVGKDFAAFVGTDNKAAGKMAGEELARLLDGKGKVVLLRYQKGSASTEAREAGFLEAMSANKGIELTSSDQESGADVQSAKTKSENMLDKLREADGIFTPNESSTVGMLLTLRQANLLSGPNRKKFVGFDATDPLIQAIEAGELDAAVAQNPVKMGHDAVATMVDKIKGVKFEPHQDTGAVLVTKESLKDPAVKALLKR